jgi:GntR family transcriptional repressor for pyruvate dehydrogenase complex
MTVKLPKTAELVAAQIRTQIVVDGIGQGHRLGSTIELEQRFGVSAPTVREAFRILEAENLIKVIRGRHGGVVVAGRAGEKHAVQAVATAMQVNQVTLADVNEARTLIEPLAVGQLAQRPDRAAAVARLRNLVARQEDAIADPDAFATANVGFHEALVAEYGNKTLLLLAGILHDLIRASVADVSRLAANEEQLRTRQRGLRSQRRVLRLIESGDAAAAESHWRKHMRMVSAIMIDVQQERAVVDHTRVRTS